MDDQLPTSVAAGSAKDLMIMVVIAIVAAIGLSWWSILTQGGN